MKINFTNKKKYLRVELNESFEYEAFLDFIKLLGNKESVKNLIDASKLKNTDLTYKERFEIGKEAVEHLYIKNKFVVVWPKRDINYFAISVMKLHGFNVRVFPTFKEAKKWLLKEQ